MLSTLSLVSLSSKSLAGLFGSMLIGAQVTFTVVSSGLSVPKTSLRATPTREIALLPTKCVLSNSLVFFPRVCITIGFVIVVLASLFCILRAKGFRSSSPSQKQNVVASQPPAPPPEPDSSSSVVKVPRRFRWLLFLMITLLVLLIIAASVAACVCFAYSVPPAIQELASFCSDKLSATETRFWAGFFTAASHAAAIGTYVCSHGLQDLKIFSIGLATHLVCIFIFVPFRSFRRRLVWLAQAETRLPVIICSLLVPIIGIVSVPQLRWIIWLRWYHSLYREGLLPSICEINWHILFLSSYLSSVALTHFIETATIIGITMIHISAAWIDSVLVLILTLPRIISTWLARLSHPHVFLCFLRCTVKVTALLCLDAVMWVPIFRYTYLAPWAKQMLYKALYCRESRSKAKEIWWYFVSKYQVWKAEQIQDFWDLAAATPNTLWTKLKSCLEIWCNLHPSHKLLITGPALAFYGYLYFLPVVRRRFRRLIARWRNRWCLALILILNSV